MVQKNDSGLQIETSSKVIHFGMFAFMWTVGILWHYLRHQADYSEFFLLLIPAVLVLARPKVGIFLLALCFGYFHVFIYTIPASTRLNHPPAYFLVNVMIVATAIVIVFKNYIRTRTINLDQEEWFDIVRPLILMSVNIIYLMAVFNKLNTDFFDINYSPVTELLNLYYDAQHLLFIPDLLPRADWFLQFSIIMTLVIETAIPLMLWSRRLRIWGVVLGVAFHMFVSIRVYPSQAEFPTLLFAVYILALPDTAIPMLRNMWANLMAQPYVKSITKGGFAALAWFFFLLPMVLEWPKKQDQLLFSHSDIWSYAWVIYLAFYTVILVYILKQTRGGFNEPADIRWIQPRYAILYIFPLIVLLNGLTPFMGMKNKGSWNMYSHLRTEGAYNNHLFMPNIRLFPFMDEVCIVNTTDEELMKIERNKRLFIEADFSKWARNHPEESIEFYYNGELINAERIGDYEQFMRPSTIWEQLFTIVTSGGGISYLDWCQQYIPNDVHGPVLYLDHFTYVLWDDRNK